MAINNEDESPITSLQWTTLQQNSIGLKQKLDNFIEWMQKNTIQDTILNEKSNIKSLPGYCILQENKPKGRSKGVRVAFIIRDTILFGELKLKTYI